MKNSVAPYDAQGVLFVDDEPHSRKWFCRNFGDEFTVVAASGADEARQILQTRGHEFAVLVTDYRMPEHDGMVLLRAVERDHRHLVRLLATAYAAKDVAIAAINQGKVLRILEKPLDNLTTREALREALALHRSQAMDRALNEGRVAALRETLGFLAHEINTPLATVRGYVSALIGRHVEPAPDSEPGIAQFTEDSPGDMLRALANAERRALYCQSLVSTFVQSARDAYPGASLSTFSASSLIEALLDEYPFEGDEISTIKPLVAHDFELPGRRDLLYLVLCTLIKNALQALRESPAPSVLIEVEADEVSAQGTAGPGKARIRVSDNGPGIEPEVLARLTHEPVTTRSQQGGHGMGLMFCRRVMLSIGGSISVRSVVGRGTQVTLEFKPFRVKPTSA